MTQKEKLAKAHILASVAKSVARDLRYDAKDFDVNFPIGRARRLEEAADAFLKLK